MILYNLLHQIFMLKPGPWRVGMSNVMIAFNAGAHRGTGVKGNTRYCLTTPLSLFSGKLLDRCFLACENKALRMNSWLLASLPPTRGFDVKLYRKWRFGGEASATAAAVFCWWAHAELWTNANFGIGIWIFYTQIKCTNWINYIRKTWRQSFRNRMLAEPLADPQCLLAPLIPCWGARCQ